MLKNNYCPNNEAHGINLDDIFCKECGARLKWYKWVCPDCGDINFDYHRTPYYCPKCGKDKLERVEW